MDIKIDWASMKSFISSRSANYHEISYGLDYFIEAYDGPIKRICKLVDGSSNHTDYVDNYQSGAGNKERKRDFDGDDFVRIKNSSDGYTFQARFMQFETSKLGSIINKKHDGSNWADATIKFYDNADVELTTQASIDTSCVKTVLDWEPTYDYDLIGGSIQLLSVPLTDVFMWCIGVPDLTEAQGGSKVMINNMNMIYLDLKETFKIDGRTSKHMVYNATYHTNKMRKVITHDAGTKCKMELCWEHYKI